MKYTLFSLACLAAIARAQPPGGKKINSVNRVGSGEARPGDHNNRTDIERFVAWATQTGKGFKGSGEFETRFSIW